MFFLYYKDQKCLWEENTRNFSFNECMTRTTSFLAHEICLMLVWYQAEGSRVDVKCIQCLGNRKQGNRSTALLFRPPLFSFIVREENPKRKLETSPFPTAISCLPVLIHSSRQSAQHRIRNLAKKKTVGTQI